MHIDPYIVLGSAVVGFLVGMTGAGGGALMTPMLILLFGVTPSAAISSDLVAAVVMRPIGATVHCGGERSTAASWAGWCWARCRWRWWGPICCISSATRRRLSRKLSWRSGVALLVGAGAMVLRFVLDRRSGERRTGRVHDVIARPLPTVAIGAIGGLVVGMTSVGSGSLMIVMLLFLYPMIGANQLVGTDLTQAVPLTLAAALGALAFGHVEFGVTASLIIGSVPAVLVGSLFSSSAPDRYIRPVITFVIAASGLKYVGIGTTTLGWLLCAMLFAAAAIWLAYGRPWQGAKVPGEAELIKVDPAPVEPAVESRQDRRRAAPQVAGNAAEGEHRDDEQDGARVLDQRPDHARGQTAGEGGLPDRVLRDGGEQALAPAQPERGIQRARRRWPTASRGCAARSQAAL